MWSSSALFRCPRFHPVATVRSKLLSSHPQFLQLSDLIILFIKLPKKRHSMTKQPITSKTQPWTAKKDWTHAHTRFLKLLTIKHALHVPPLTTIVSQALHAPVPSVHAPEPVKCCSMLALGWHHLAHVITWCHQLTSSAFNQSWLIFDLSRSLKTFFWSIKSCQTAIQKLLRIQKPENLLQNFGSCLVFNKLTSKQYTRHILPTVFQPN